MKTNKRRSVLSSCTVLSVLFGLSTQAYAQALEEVVVTAQKREQNVMDVPISVTAMSGNTLESLGIYQAADLMQQVPNFSQVSFFGEGYRPNLSIRGITLGQYTDNFEAPVALYVNDVYKSSVDGQSMAMFDVAGVEVLRGPQGTLYGRNAFAGVMHFKSRKPGEEFGFNINAEYGSYENRVIQWGVDLPVSKSVRARIAGRSQENDGWIEGFTDGRTSGNVDSDAFRATVEFDLSESASLVVRAHSAKSDSLTPIGTPVGYQTSPGSGEYCSVGQAEAGNCFGNLFGIDFQTNETMGGFGQEQSPGSNRTQHPLTQVDIDGVSARLDWAVNGMDVTYIFGLDRVDKYFTEDTDGPFLLGFEDGFTLDAKQITHEIRVSGGGSDSIQWMAGAYYFDDNRDTGSFLLSFFDPSDDSPEGYAQENAASSTTESWSVFANADVPLKDNVNLTLGLRYTEDDRAAIMSNFDPFGFTQAGNFTGLKRSRTDGQTTGKLGIDWSPNEDMIIFGSVSSGFQTGGSNTQLVFGPIEAYDPVGPQTIVSYEVGVKSTIWDGKAQYSATAFYNDISDLQGNVFVTTDSAPLGGTILLNFGDSTTYGAEIELKVRPTENFYFSVGLGLLDTELTNQFDPLLEGAERNVSPNYALNGLVTYTIPLQDIGEFVVQIDGTYTDGYGLGGGSGGDFPTSPYGRNQAYGLLNASLSLNFCEDNRCSATVFATNITDTEYKTTLVAFGDDWGVGFYNQPTRFGVRLGYQL